MSSLTDQWRRWVPLLAGPLLFALLQLAMPAMLIDPMPRIVLGLSVWMGVWWVTEPVPIVGRRHVACCGLQCQRPDPGWISDQLQLLDGVSYFWLLLFMVLLMLFLTEIISNTATANMAIPITAGLASAIRSV